MHVSHDGDNDILTPVQLQLTKVETTFVNTFRKKKKRRPLLNESTSSGNVLLKDFFLPKEYFCELTYDLEGEKKL